MVPQLIASYFSYIVFSKKECFHDEGDFKTGNPNIDFLKIAIVTLLYCEKLYP